VVDAINGVLWLLIAASNPFSPRALALMGFVTVLVVLALIDLEHQILPDMITLPGIVVGVALTQLPGWPVSLLDSALSAALGYFAMMILAKAAEMYYREEALGQGDWKMIAMLGAFLGSTKLAFVALAANLLGALVGLLMIAIMGDEGRQRLPLGTFLGACGITIIFF
jgi:leader peptidase (prepilin peptidase)/N-methyltransferase